MTDAILVLNAGSSSVKFALYEARTLALLCRGGMSGLGETAKLSVTGPLGPLIQEHVALSATAAHAQAVTALIAALHDGAVEVTLVAAGHRVVHGGARFASPVPVDEDVFAELSTFSPLAPNHQPHNLAAIRAVAKAWPDLPQVACFDTAFHRTQPRLAQLFALPRALTEEGILRYGFHGLSYDYIASVLPRFAGARADARVIVAHLGHGASMCAMHGRQSIATTMGFTALEGLMMGTRCGALDPGVVLHLLQQKQMTAKAVDDLLNNRCGLLGVSGLSDDVRALEQSRAPEAAEALDLFAYRAAREIGSLVAALGGLDVLVFTAGIGEHAAGMRARILDRSRWTGIEPDADANARNAARISASSSAVDVFVIPTDEEIVIARATAAVCGG
jgi:acetate kinase